MKEKNSHSGQGIGIESSVSAVGLRSSGHIWRNKSGDWSVIWCPIDETEGLLSAD